MEWFNSQNKTIWGHPYNYRTSAGERWDLENADTNFTFPLKGQTLRTEREDG